MAMDGREGAGLEKKGRARVGEAHFFVQRQGSERVEAERSECNGYMEGRKRNTRESRPWPRTYHRCQVRRFQVTHRIQLCAEIFELGIGYKFGAMAGTHECSVFALPCSRCIRIARPPPAQILAVEQRSGLPPLGLDLSFQVRRPLARPLPWSPILPRCRPNQRVP